MTLCLAGLNRTNVIVVADRRLTVNGKPSREDRTKLTLVETRDARGVIAFAGLAEAGRFRTDRWLLEALREAAPPEYTLGAVLERLRVAAAKDVNALGLDTEVRRLSFYFAGFGYPDGHADDPRIAYCIVSNFERVGERLGRGSLDTFEITGRMEIAREERTDEAPAAVLIGGNHPVVARADVDGFLRLLEDDAPASALVGKAIDVVRDTARRPEAAGTIGEDVLTAVIPNVASIGAELSHSPNVLASYVTAANMAHLGGVDDLWVAREFTLRPDAPGVKIVPKVGRTSDAPAGAARSSSAATVRDGNARSRMKTGSGLAFQHVVRNSRDFHATTVTFADARRASLVSWHVRYGLSSPAAATTSPRVATSGARSSVRRSPVPAANTTTGCREIAGALGCHYATISRRLRAFEKDGVP